MTRGLETNRRLLCQSLATGGRQRGQRVAKQEKVEHRFIGAIIVILHESPPASHFRAQCEAALIPFPLLLHRQIRPGDFSRSVRHGQYHYCSLPPQPLSSTSANNSKHANLSRTKRRFMAYFAEHGDRWSRQ